MSAVKTQFRRGFSLIELVIVVVIIGIIAAIAIPRMSRGASGAADSALSGDLAVLRNAIDLFQTEHPTAANNGYPTVANILNQLTQFSDDAGAAQAAKDTTHIFGPYLRAIPAVPVGPRKGQSGIAAADAAAVGWLYTEATGVITANVTTETDAKGKQYITY
jgi:general secretion pathway protein G